MSLPPKILWSEGLALDVQHFQQLDRYHETRLQHIASAINPYAWGIQLARWDIESLARNKLHASALTLIFPDGEIYHAPYTDALPAPIDLGKLPLNEHCFVFYAALPAVKAHGGNLANADMPRDEGRYSPFESETLDLFTEALPVNVAYLRKTLRLLSHLDSRSAYDCIPVVKVRRKADSSFEIDPTFMPPSLSAGAEPAMQEMLHSLLGKLAAKVEALYHLQRQPRGNMIEVHGGDMSSFWMLGTISTAGASLTHYANSGNCHPEQLFDKLMILAGGLMAFSNKFTFSDLPKYEHENPAPGFFALDSIIRELLDTVLSSKYYTIPLTIDKERNQYHQGQLDAALSDAKARLYIAINADMPALSLVTEVPRQFKIASPFDIDSLVRSALPGIQLLHMAQVPMEVPVRPNTYYFSIENRGERYEAMMKAQAIAIYAPNTIEDLRIELFAITH